MSLHREREHPEYVEGCFGCKISTLQTNSGDASGGKGMPNKKWDGELQAYRDARAQGIQPAGTSMKNIVAAHKASETLGSAYDANTMVKASKLDKRTANVMNQLKEAGV